MTSSDEQSAELHSEVPAQPRHLGWALVLISTAQLVVVLDSTIATIALPFMGRDLDIAAANLSWIVTGYALAFGGLLLLGGRLGDLYGRRRIFMAGLFLFACASALGGLATNEATLLAARAAQGAGAALAAPAALALITTTFPAGAGRNRAFAVYAAMSGAGAAVGLVLGGWLTGLDESLGWRLTFLINVPLCLVAVMCAPRILVESEPRPGAVDVPGTVTATLGLMSVVYGLTRSGERGWNDAGTLATLLMGAVLLAAFLVIERRVEHPLLPSKVFMDRTRAASFMVMFLVPSAMFALFFFLSQYVQNVMGYSPLRTGVAFLPFTLGIVFASGVASHYVSRVDPRSVAGVGGVLAAGAMLGFSRLPYDASLTTWSRAEYWTDLFPFIVLMALGLGLIFVPLTLTAVHRLPPEDSGVGSGVLNTVQQVGGALGLAVLASTAVQVADKRSSEIESLVEAATRAGGADAAERAQVIAASQVFAESASTAYVVGCAFMVAATVILLTMLDVKHTELSAGTAKPEEIEA